MKRSQNKVKILKDEQNQWVGDPGKLLQIARNFYMQLYSADPIPSFSQLSSLLPTFFHVDCRLLNHSVTLVEIKKAVFNMGPNKGPGPHGFVPAFFQQY